MSECSFLSELSLSEGFEFQSRLLLKTIIYIYIYVYALADAFIQSDLHCIQVTVLHFINSCFPWESNPWSWRASAMLSIWATESCIIAS